MYLCPHCKIKCISFYEKFSSGLAIPVVCKECKKLSCFSSKASFINSLFLQLVFYSSIVAALFFWNLWVFVISLLLYSVVEAIFCHCTALSKVELVNVSRARKYFLLFSALFVLLVI